MSSFTSCCCQFIDLWFQRLIDRSHHLYDFMFIICWLNFFDFIWFNSQFNERFCSADLNCTQLIWLFRNSPMLPNVTMCCGDVLCTTFLIVFMILSVCVRAFLVAWIVLCIILHRCLSQHIFSSFSSRSFLSEINFKFFRWIFWWRHSITEVFVKFASRSFASKSSSSSTRFFQALLQTSARSFRDANWFDAITSNTTGGFAGVYVFAVHEVVQVDEMEEICSFGAPYFSSNELTSHFIELTFGFHHHCANGLRWLNF